MTALADLERVARSLPQPVDPYLGPCRAYVSEVAGAWRVVWALDGGRRQHSAGPAFPLDRAGGRDARRLSKLLNGTDRPTSRPAADDFAGAGAPASEDARLSPEAPDDQFHRSPGGAVAGASTSPAAAVGHARVTVGEASDPVAASLDPAVVGRYPAAAGVRTCLVCGRGLPLSKRGQHRRTCSLACRVALSRGHGATNAPEADADSDVTPSAAQRPSEAVTPVPTSMSAASGAAPSSPRSRTPEPSASPISAESAVLELGL